MLGLRIGARSNNGKPNENILASIQDGATVRVRDLWPWTCAERTPGQTSAVAHGRATIQLRCMSQDIQTS